MATTALAEDLVDFLTARNSYDPLNTSSALARTWVLGDILHSKPVIQQYDTTRKIMLVGSNDGFLHCFSDFDNGDNEGSAKVFSNDTIEEKWCFVPWDIIPNLHYLHESGADHQIYIDGCPVLYASGTNMLTTFGLRRGGTGYYTLNVGSADPSSGLMNSMASTPSWAWGITSAFLASAGAETLGQSWCTPVTGNVKVGADTKKAVFFSGGYDTVEDQDHYGGGATPITTPLADSSFTQGQGTLRSGLIKWKPHYADKFQPWENKHDDPWNNRFPWPMTTTWMRRKLIDTVYAGRYGRQPVCVQRQERHRRYVEQAVAVYGQKHCIPGLAQVHVQAGGEEGVLG
jgi:hypothetical protein